MIVTIIGPIMCVVFAVAFYRKRESLLKLASAADDPSERDAFRRSADNQIWKIVLFAIPGVILAIMCLGELFK